MNSLIRKNVAALSAYVPGEQPTVPGLIKLNTNENPYGPPESVRRALAEFDPDSLRLYPEPTSRALREALAERHGCRPEQVFVGNGSDEILSLCFRAFVEADASVGYFTPSYSLYPVLAAIAGVACEETPLGENFGWADPRVRPCTSLFFLTHPNAPTGTVYERSQLTGFIRRFPGVVVLDEAYADFSDAPCADLALQFRNVLVTRSFSKSLSLAGMRVGFAIGPADLIEALHKVRDSYNLDAIAQRLALAALEGWGEVEESLRRVVATREKTAAQLEALDMEVFPSQTNFLWVRPRWCPAEKLFADLRQAGILVRFFPGPRTGRFLRVTIGTEEHMDRLIEVLTPLKENA